MTRNLFRRGLQTFHSHKVISPNSQTARQQINIQGIFIRCRIKVKNESYFCHPCFRLGGINTSPEDEFEDIGIMLANLTDELDAMILKEIN